MSAERILVIDDSEVMLGRIRRALTAAGYEVTTTTLAVGNARFIPNCDLVIIDYHMPGIEGDTVIAGMRTSVERSGHDCLLYLYTSDRAVAARYAELGFDGCFTSKGDEETLVRQVASAFRRRKIRAVAERTRPSTAPGPSQGPKPDRKTIK
jgi:CheY-like chemotaxis protein